MSDLEIVIKALRDRERWLSYDDTIDGRIADTLCAVARSIEEEAKKQEPDPAPPRTPPAIYNGVPVPQTMLPNWDSAEAMWWRFGVDRAKDIWDR